MEETAFIRKGLTFWKCSVCGGWHEGQVHKCPIKKVFDDIDKFRSCGRSTDYVDIIDMSLEDYEELKKRHLSTSKLKENE